ncbi:leucyl aminopeptidase family protein [Chelatococcus reniformis]|uniref:Aminopeptidase n=1 Tax=Chelatococcus reniformis TaxID=1494448 RepID=A0A916XRU3_9HYPH|nr:leucyl aminopeptidase family protein [Chelatococcus reniformis]GGC93705.1 aminopeptidase [Chelatococcus reniformis]
MLPSLLAHSNQSAVPIHFVDEANWPDVAAGLPALARAFAAAQGFKPQPGKALVLPAADGGLGAVLFGLDRPDARRPDPFLAGALAGLLPAGTYAFANAPEPIELAVLAFVLGGYSFDRYRTAKRGEISLVAPPGVDIAEVGRQVDAVVLARDLINTPANDLGPDGLERTVRLMAERHGASFGCIVGDGLLEAKFPMIHAVGRASATAPRLIDMAWGPTDAPKVTLVGKGVSFDTGGLDIKPSAAMLLMKKDMGGAAAALAAADMIMSAGLHVRLRVLIPAVENAISGSAFRPGDVLPSHKGLTVEIGNTDAEGRLILADALSLADEEAPELLVDFATLTGAARTALGPELPPLYSRDDALAADLARLGERINDPVWRMPLWPPYEKMLDSKIADVNHVSSGPFAGSITAALFLSRFVSRARSYAHLDIYGWSPSARPGRPEGGEAQGARLIYALLRERYPAHG